jgi:hypothetical protein
MNYEKNIKKINSFFKKNEKSILNFQSLCMIENEINSLIDDDITSVNEIYNIESVNELIEIVTDDMFEYSISDEIMIQNIDNYRCFESYMNENVIKKCELYFKNKTTKL